MPELLTEYAVRDLALRTARGWVELRPEHWRWLSLTQLHQSLSSVMQADDDDDDDDDDDVSVLVRENKWRNNNCNNQYFFMICKLNLYFILTFVLSFKMLNL